MKGYDMKKINVKLKIKKMGGEYCLQWIEGGCLDESKSYYTDSLTDAKETRQAVIDAYNMTKKTNIKIN